MRVLLMLAVLAAACDTEAAPVALHEPEHFWLDLSGERTCAEACELADGACTHDGGCNEDAGHPGPDVLVANCTHDFVAMPVQFTTICCCEE